MAVVPTSSTVSKVIAPTCIYEEDASATDSVMVGALPIVVASAA
jgi:hypothetical protein